MNEQLTTTAVPGTPKVDPGAPINAGHGSGSEHIEQFFAYGHLPPHLQTVSAPFCELAYKIINELPHNPERTVALRKLLESKDAAVRALVAK